MFPLANRMSGLMKNVDHVFTFDRGEGSQEIFDRRPAFQEVEKILDGYPCPRKTGNTPGNLRVA